MTTGRQARLFGSAASRATDSDEKAWLATAAAALDEVAELRNQVVHARPATIDSEQMLNRWATATDTKAHEAFPVDEGFLVDLRNCAADHVARLSEVRLPSAPA